MSHLTHKVYSFESFVLDLDRASLLRDGQAIKLRPKSFETLKYLLENRGRLVSKDELIHAVWPDSFVTDDSLVQCLRDVRRALGDDSQHFIKTIPRRGYIFDAQVLEHDPAASGMIFSEEVEGVQVVFQEVKEEGHGDKEAPKGWAGSSTKLRSARRLLVGMAAVVGLAVGTVVIYLFLATRSQAPNPPWVIKPLTSYVGSEEGVTWSPDARFIAYGHAVSGGMKIFVKSKTGGDPVRLTDGPQDDILPRWAPDGRYLAFLSDHGTGSNIYLIPPLGGTPRKLVETNIPFLEQFDDAFGALGAMPWSPEGQELLFSRLQPRGEIEVWKVNLQNGTEDQLTYPQPGSADLCASWSFDGQWIAFHRRQGGLDRLCLMPTKGGEPRLLLSDQYDNNQPAWSADSRRVVFVSNRAGPLNLWEIEIGSHRLRQLTTGPWDWYPSVAPNGPLAYEQFSQQTDLFRMNLNRSGEDRLTFQTRDSFAPRFSPDGKKIVYHSNRTGNDEIWLLDLDSKAERPLTNHPATDVLPDWSPDGREIVFLSDRGGNFQLWVMNTEGGAVRRLIDQVIPQQGQGCTALRLAPRWSPDGKSIGYLAPSDRGIALWAVDRDGKNARPCLYGALRFDWYRDSQHVVYTRIAIDGSSRREMNLVDLESGREITLHRGPHAELVAAPDGHAVAYCQAASHFNQDLYMLRLVPSLIPGDLPRVLGEPEQLTRGQSIFHVHNGGWSRDGKSIVYIRITEQGDINVIENYR